MSKLSRAELKAALRTKNPVLAGQRKNQSSSPNRIQKRSRSNSYDSWSSESSSSSDLAVDYVMETVAPNRPAAMIRISERYGNDAIGIGKGVVFCSECNERFQNNRKLYDKHVKTRHEFLQCVICEQQLTYADYVKHTRKEHGIRGSRDTCKWCLQPKHGAGLAGRVGCPVLVLFEMARTPYVGGERKLRGRKKGDDGTLSTKYNQTTKYNSNDHFLKINDVLEIGQGRTVKTLRRSQTRFPDPTYPCQVVSGLVERE